MKVSELKKSTAVELNAKNKELTKEMFNLRFQLHTGRLENTSKLAQLRKDIARVNTILREMRG